MSINYLKAEPAVFKIVLKVVLCFVLRHKDLHSLKRRKQKASYRVWGTSIQVHRWTNISVIGFFLKASANKRLFKQQNRKRSTKIQGPKTTKQSRIFSEKECLIIAMSVLNNINAGFISTSGRKAGGNVSHTRMLSINGQSSGIACSYILHRKEITSTS